MFRLFSCKAHFYWDIGATNEWILNREKKDKKNK